MSVDQHSLESFEIITGRIGRHALLDSTTRQCLARLVDVLRGLVSEQVSLFRKLNLEFSGMLI